MIHPLFRALVARPDLLADHGASYASLACAEASDALSRFRLRATLLALAAACLVLAVAFAGTAALLVAVIPLDEMPAAWVLGLVPLLPGVLALSLWWAQRSLPMRWDFPLLRQQAAVDRLLLEKLAEGEPS